MTRRVARGYLVALDPLLIQPQYPVFPEGTTIGRDSDICEVIASNEFVSRRHCAILSERDRTIELVDLDSSNGTFVNRERIKRCVLSHGDHISCGRPSPPHFVFSESPPSNARTYVLPPQNVYRIGRDSSNDLPLVTDLTVSSFHARLRNVNGTLFIDDLGSSNGTFCNSLLVSNTRISPDDTIQIGSTELAFALTTEGLHVRCRKKQNQIRLESRNICRVHRGRHLLRDIDLVIEPGEFVGVLGPSGAGKSTLLNALNGFVPADSGNVLLNGLPLYSTYDLFRNAIGYVPQDDIIHKELTVERSLFYTAQLRLPRDTTQEQLSQHVTSVIETLGLTHVRENYVTQLSGGQRKRVSIGCELLTRPSLVFLDEPTSGLDPSTEEKLMKHFRLMAEQGQTVILTTHILYNLGLLDLVVLLARGRLVYFGPVAEVCSYFSTPDVPVERPIQVFDLLEPETPDPEVREERAEYYERKYRESGLYQQYVVQRLDASKETNAHVELAAAKAPLMRGIGPRLRAFSRALQSLLDTRQLLILVRRTFDLRFSFPSRLAMPLLMPVLLALLILTVSVQNQGSLDRERQEYLTDHQSGLSLLNQTGLISSDEFMRMRFEGFPNLGIPISIPLIMVMTAVFMGTLSACLEISGERPVYLRERSVNLSIPVYLASKLPVLFLLSSVQCFIYILLSMFSIRASNVNVLALLLTTVGVAWVSCLIGLFISSLDPTSGHNSVVLAVIVVLPQLLFSGAMAPNFWGGMGRMTQTIASLFPSRWGFELLLTTFYRETDWAGGLITRTTEGGMGFRFGPDVYFTNGLALLLLGLGYFIATCVSLRRYDTL